MKPRARDSLISWLVVGPFAILLAFPFYWMLMTSLKTNGDLYDIEHNPFVFNAVQAAANEDQPLRGQGWLPLGIENITTRNYTFLFDEPGIHYLDWLKNTALVGGIVVLITLALSLPAGYALARLSGGWGQSAGRRHLPRLPRPADAPLPAVVAGRRRARFPGSARLADPRLPVLHRALLDVAADGFLQDDPARARGCGDGGRGIAAESPDPGRLPDLAARDPDRGHLLLLALRERVHLRRDVHLHVRRAHRLDGSAARADPRRRLFLAVADGGDADPGHPPGPALQHVPGPLHRWFHRRAHFGKEWFSLPAQATERSGNGGRRARTQRVVVSAGALTPSRAGYGRAHLQRRGAEDVRRRRAEVPAQGAPEDAPDHPVAPLRARLRHVVRQHVHEGLGPEERHRGHRRPHQPHGPPCTGGLGGRRAERPRHLPAPLAARGL